MKYSLPECPTCGARCVRYQRVRHRDAEAQDEFDLFVGPNALHDVLVFTCGATHGRAARLLHQQPLGGNGYVTYDVEPEWKTMSPCTEAERVVRELREKHEEEK